MRRELSKFFYKIGCRKLSRWCDKGTYIGLCMNQIAVSLEKFARACEQARLKLEEQGGNGETNEKNTTAQDEQ